MDHLAVKIRNDRQRLETVEAARAAKRVGWRERLFGGLLGGDREAGHEYQRLSRARRQLQRSIPADQARWEREAAAVDKLLAPSLGSVDPVYAEHVRALQTLEVRITEVISTR